TENILCTGDVELSLGKQTTARTQELLYGHTDRRILVNTHVTLERPGVVNGESNFLEYVMSSGLLKVAGGVKIHTNEGMELESVSAVFDERQNHASAEDNVLLKYRTGWVRGARARFELTPQTFKPRSIWIEGNVSSEATTATPGETVKVKADSMEAQLS